MSNWLASVALPIPIYSDFTYRVPMELQNTVVPGSVVEVEFHGSRRIGCVTSLQMVDSTLDFELKDISSLLFPQPLARWQMDLARMISHRTFSTYGESIKLFVPEYRSSWKKSMGKRVFFNKGAGDLLDTLKMYGIIPDRKGIQLFLFKELCQLSSKKLKELIKKNWITVCEESRRGDQISLPHQESKRFWWQRGVLSESVKLLQDLVEEVTRQGRKMILIFPGIQVLDYYYETFQSLNPSIRFLKYDGRLTPRQRWVVYQMVLEGYYDIVVGTRLALFLPIHAVTVHLLFDPEEYGHTSDRSPRYHSFFTLLDKVNLTGGDLHVVGSVPDLTIYHGLQTGYFQSQTTIMTGINRNHKIEQVTYEKKKPILTLTTQKAIAENLSHKRNTVIWTQKTGYSAALGCSDCGYYYICPDCEVALRFFYNERLLQCPRCGKRQIPEDFCPQCRGTWMRTWGEGVEKILLFLKRTFPGVSIEPVTADQEKAGLMIWQKEPVVLVGTSAVLREDILNRVSLLIIHSFEDWLFLPDFQVREKFFQEIHTALTYIGSMTDGINRVIIEGSKRYQKYMDQFFQPASDFYSIEMEKRKKFHYPPWGNLLQVIAKSRNREGRWLVLNKIKNECHHSGVIVDGPFPSVSSRKQSAWSDELMIKFDSEHLAMVYDGVTRTIGSRKTDGVEIDFKVYSILS